jgi:arginyl-tRNA--protein-N-Asp/Glu arginylyltransferase
MKVEAKGKRCRTLKENSDGRLEINLMNELFDLFAYNNKKFHATIENGKAKVKGLEDFDTLLKGNHLHEKIDKSQEKS